MIWFLGSSSKVDAKTVAPSTFSFISVTSSGLSSINNIHTSVSFWPLIKALAIELIKVVFPAFGGAIISALCPFPIGDIKSRILPEILSCSNPSLNCCVGSVSYTHLLLDLSPIKT